MTMPVAVMEGQELVMRERRPLGKSLQRA